MISALKYVDTVLAYTDIDKTIERISFDIFAVGGDQIHSGFKKAIAWCNENGKEVVHLDRTEGVSSSMLRKEIINRRKN